MREVKNQDKTKNKTENKTPQNIACEFYMPLTIPNPERRESAAALVTPAFTPKNSHSVIEVSPWSSFCSLT